MYKKILTQTALSTVLTLTEVKRQCRVFTDFEDDYLTSLIPVYADLAQSYTNRMLTEGTAVVAIEEYSPVILLPYGEVTEVTKVELDGVESTAFTFDDVTQKVKISEPYSECKIYFSCGYVGIPDVVKAAICMMISTAYNNRDDVVVGQTIAEMPRRSLDLLDRVRL